MENIKNKPESAKFSGIFSAQIKKNVKFWKKSETNHPVKCTWLVVLQKWQGDGACHSTANVHFWKEKEENDEKICEIPQKSAKFWKNYEILKKKWNKQPAYMHLHSGTTQMARR